jgi:hypothetical protein
VVAPLDTDSFLAYAARGRSVRLVTEETQASLPALPFSGRPSAVITLPIAVHGDLLALIYADDEGAPLPAGAGTDALKLAYLLQRHASLRIERLTVELKTLAELRAYAQMLVDEVEYVYEADSSAQKPVEERLSRLQDNLRCARQIFQQRVTVEDPPPNLLRRVVARTVAGKQARRSPDPPPRRPPHRRRAGRPRVARWRRGRHAIGYDARCTPSARFSVSRPRPAHHLRQARPVWTCRPPSTRRHPARHPVDLRASIALPEGFEAQVRPRLGHKHGHRAQRPGTIDSDYRGEAKALDQPRSGPFVITT